MCFVVHWADPRSNMSCSVLLLLVIYLYEKHFLYQTEKALELVGKFEAISGAQLDMTEKYMRIMMAYGRDLEHIRKLYQKHKADPIIPRNLPPVSGRIAWARQLYRKIEMPMRVFMSKPEIIKVRFLRGCGASFVCFKKKKKKFYCFILHHSVIFSPGNLP